MSRLDRRTFLKGLGAVAGAAGLGATTAGCSDGPSTARGTRRAGRRAGPTTTTPSITHDSIGLPIAQWVVEENRRPGTTNWLVRGAAHVVEGYTGAVSAVAGDEVPLYIRSNGGSVSVDLYRMGWYGGHGARLMAHLGTTSTGAVTQPDPSFTPGINMVECHWAPSLRFDISPDWPTGYYLIRLQVRSGISQWVPLVIRDDASTSRVLVQSAVTTWQAYSLYGGYSLYFGSGRSGQSYANRSRVVSFDRPYLPSDEDGSADFFGDEYPLVAMLERDGVDVSYWTDVDLHERANLLSRHAVLVSLGHDEYWSPAMRYGVQDAVDKGLNLAVLGANACYRRIRFEDSPVGPNRRQVCYKDGTEDPLYGKDNAAVTANWNEPPDPRPESSLIGIMYQAYLGRGDMTIVDTDHFAFSGTGLKPGDRIPGIIGSEFDRYVPGPASPANVQILCHGPTPSVIGELTTDMSWYTTKSGGGVFATGTAAWVDRLWDNNGLLPQPFAPGPIAGVTPAVTRITENVLAVLSNGPASKSHPSAANWQQYYSVGSGAPPPPVDDAATT